LPSFPLFPETTVKGLVRVCFLSKNKLVSCIDVYFKYPITFNFVPLPNAVTLLQ
jgi:hypothetical protein